MRLIDADALIEWFMPFLHEDEKIEPDTVISDIRAFPTITLPSNNALTLDELREMDGEPVWITPGGFWALVIAKPCERVRLICNDGESVWADKEIELVGPVYRRKPEEGTE